MASCCDADQRKGVHIGDTSGDTIAEVADTSASLIVLRDTQVGILPPCGYLRSLPLLTTVGVETAVYPLDWESPVTFVDHTSLATEAIDGQSIPETPFVYYLPQRRLQECDEQARVRTLFERFNDADEPGQCVIITDTVAPKTPAFTKKPGKSLVDEFACSVQDYTSLFKSYLTENVASMLPVGTTRNLFYHQISAVHEQAGAPASTLTDLFNFDRAPPSSPIWEFLNRVLHAELVTATDRDVAIESLATTLQAWTETTDATPHAITMYETLAACEFDREQLTEYRSTTENN
jgi:hypothetical protein